MQTKNIPPILLSISYIVLFLDCSLRRRKSCNRHAERRTAHIIQPHLVAELHGRRLTAMLAADTALQVRTDGTALFGSHTYQLPYSILVEHLEGVYFQNLLFQINRQEGSDVVA